MARLGSRSAGAEGPVAVVNAGALAGLDSLETVPVRKHPWSARNVWATVWPKLLAIGLVIGVWEIIHLTRWKEYVLPGPGARTTTTGPPAARARMPAVRRSSVEPCHSRAALGVPIREDRPPASTTPAETATFSS